MKTNRGTSNSSFQWQAGYAGFSVSQSNLPDIKKYIENQVKHHHRMTFQEELRAMLNAMESILKSGMYGPN